MDCLPVLLHVAEVLIAVEVVDELLELRCLGLLDVGLFLCLLLFGLVKSLKVFVIVYFYFVEIWFLFKWLRPEMLVHYLGL